MSSTPMSSSTRARSRTATASSAAASAAASRRRRRASNLARACMTKRRRLAGRGTCSSSLSSSSPSSSSLSSSNDVVSEKLEALKNLIPVTKSSGDDAVAADELFQETADYILRLRTQVVILQKLIHFYGSADLPEKEGEIDDASSVL
ncbi:hypothetical protein BT93_I0901 [Corymbia citriodora subsp. variegata]|nr:hypothetical protein BT93_I0901 [Corymbia citriodora subsp. variegata]